MNEYGANATFKRNDEVMNRIQNKQFEIKVLGGNYLVTSIEDIAKWYNSLNEDTYGIVSFSFSGKKYLWDYFSEDTQKNERFKHYTIEIEKRITDYSKKFDLLKTLFKNHKTPKKMSGDGDDIKLFTDGFCDGDYINKDIFHLHKDDGGPSEIFFKGSLKRPKQTITGYKLYACGTKGEQGTFEINMDPILKTKYDFYFANHWYPFSSGTDNTWDVTICYVDLEK